ncbi:hypothetical protein QJS10_CPB11g01633 [Acorus calamus]|uniref:Uncharacterized protein n=1 Tax=Acorus calamus TaxID=4465 RepID=A0AAV9DS16_ACOCL|nr:hypothetical protein QJS10_CPB11g01633 [Acorus calamus]
MSPAYNNLSDDGAGEVLPKFIVLVSLSVIMTMTADHAMASTGYGSISVAAFVALLMGLTAVVVTALDDQVTSAASYVKWVLMVSSTGLLHYLLGAMAVRLIIY